MLPRVSALQDLIQVSDPYIRRVTVPELHFSMVNFYSRRLNGSGFEGVRGKIEQEPWLDDFRKYCSKEVFRRVKEMEQGFTIKRLYKDEKNDNYGDGSVGVNLIANDTRWVNVLEEIREEAEEKLKELDVKDYDPKYSKRKIYLNKEKDGEHPHAAVNIFRIFTGASDYSRKEMREQMWKIEESLRESPIDFKLTKPVLVISDNYLFNPHPVILEG